MNKFLIVILIISLFFIEGCTVIGHSIGRNFKKKETIEREKIENIKENDEITISMKNKEVIKGKFISCVNDTLSVSSQQNSMNSPISNSHFLSVSAESVYYKIPLNQIEDVIIRKSDYRTVGMLIGLTIDLFMIIYACSTYETFNLEFSENDN